MRSPKWVSVRTLALERACYRCERCGKRGRLQVHHRTYVRLGHERVCDLEVLCRACHARADAERAQDTEIRRWQARASGWAKNVYGESWRALHTQQQVEREFRRWLKRRGEHGI